MFAPKNFLVFVFMVAVVRRESGEFGGAQARRAFIARFARLRIAAQNRFRQFEREKLFPDARVSGKDKSVRNPAVANHSPENFFDLIVSD
jgi:hypothetical protein